MSLKTASASWLAKLTRLRPAQGQHLNSGTAPHKPLLLLSLLDLADNTALPGVLARSASLVLRFRAYGALVAERWPTRLDLRLPFFHLKTQGFWKAFDSDHRPATTPETCTSIELDPEFHSVLADPSYRLDARLVLTKAYFTPPERIALLEAMGLRDRSTIEERTEQVTSAAIDNAKRKGRSASFQIGVVDGYHHTCALTGYRCLTEDGATAVDAAHIEAWADTQNDDLGNGLALSKTAHWMFDEGLWSINDDLHVVINASRFLETGPKDICLASFANKPLRFASATRLRPSAIHLRRHREKHGFEVYRSR
jgi:putative restriction endonuclease